jgi:hypothetical protein
VLVHWCVGALVHWCIGVLVYGVVCSVQCAMCGVSGVVCGIGEYGVWGVVWLIMFIVL